MGLCIGCLGHTSGPGTVFSKTDGTLKRRKGDCSLSSFSNPADSAEVSLLKMGKGGRAKGNLAAGGSVRAGVCSWYIPEREWADRPDFRGFPSASVNEEKVSAGIVLPPLDALVLHLQLPLRAGLDSPAGNSAKKRKPASADAGFLFSFVINTAFPSRALPWQACRSTHSGR